MYAKQSCICWNTIKPQDLIYLHNYKNSFKVFGPEMILCILPFCVIIVELRVLKFCKAVTLGKHGGLAKLLVHWIESPVPPGPEVIKLFTCSTQLSMKFKPLIITETTKIG